MGSHVFLLSLLFPSRIWFPILTMVCLFVWMHLAFWRNAVLVRDVYLHLVEDITVSHGMYVCIFEILGRVNISGHWRPWWIITGDNDGQMIFGDLGCLNFPDICLKSEEKPQKTSSRKLVRPGIEPGPATWQARMLPPVPQRWTYQLENWSDCLMSHIKVRSYITTWTCSGEYCVIWEMWFGH